MRRYILAALVFIGIGALAGCDLSSTGTRGQYEVAGVEEGDLLKLRAGPGIGYRVIVGMPNGTLLQVYNCQQTGGTRWCKVTLEQSPSVDGYVSWAYLRQS